MRKVFVSYCHRQGDWVWNRLTPCLRYAGAELLIDRERFELGKGVMGQMDRLQDKADIHLLVLSDDYLKSKYCRHEMDRAIDADPTFTKGLVLPLKTDASDLPGRFGRVDSPLYLDMRDDSCVDAWERLFRACRVDLGTSAPHWLSVADDLALFLDRRQSVGLVVYGKNLNWRGLIQHVMTSRAPKLVAVDLDNPKTIERHGLLAEILNALRIPHDISSDASDLSKFSEALKSREPSLVALKHFDNVCHRDYGAELPKTLRHLIKDARKLVLLTQSHRPQNSFLPWNQEDSPLITSSVDLKGRE
ncbi:MAG: toll/interleukin-1 receptor domain-containing protein [Planctomycetota bacterium]|nr:toll/interleukin-1 receptor domain-containing protein [Planctomycetota bacterium]